KNLKVLLVSLDLPADLHTKLKPFVEKYKLTAQVVLLDDPDENKWIPKVDESWSGALPATLIYNKNKRAFYERTFTKETLFNEINNF
ncbi:MAG: TlpA family protein disulfide reductase, partial [Flavobacteriaceae bacterium]|nr:TlpA family protein disulfide reductase [Flavobacteriaceae bacterium]